MPRERLSISRLMALVAIVALDIAVVRFAIARPGLGRDLAVLVIPIWLAMQLGFERIIHGASSVRPFWIGFTASCAATASLLLVTCLSEAPVPLALLRSYLTTLHKLLELTATGRSLLANEASSLLATSLWTFVPQFLFALTLGTLASKLAGGKHG